MTEIDQPSALEFDSQEYAWEEFEDRLAAYLSRMGHFDDHLILQSPDSGGELAAPYAQVDVVRPGQLRAEVSGATVLEEIHRLDDAGQQALERLGWESPDPDLGFPNHHAFFEADEVDLLARMIRYSLSEVFGLADPELLSYTACGPAAATARELGIAATEDLPSDRVGRGTVPAVVPHDREALLTLVGTTLAELLGHDVERDEDDDYALDGPHRSYVRVRGDEPTIEIFTRLVHDVGSRRRTAVELALLNRDVQWSKFYLADRSVFMSVSIPGAPYCADHVRALVPRFQQTVLEVRDDLALRTGAVIG